MRHRWLIASLLVTAAMAACFGSRRGASREGFARTLEAHEPAADLPTRDALLALRIPEPAPIPAELSLRAATSPLDAERLASARADFGAVARAVATTPGAMDTELLARRCLLADARGRPEEIQRTCLRFVEHAPGDARVPAAVAMLSAAAAETGDGELLLHKGAARWLDACAFSRGDCAGLVAALSDELVAQARMDGGSAGVRQAARRAGRLLWASARGPFRGDDVIAFGDGDVPVPLVDDPPFTGSFRLDSDDGVLLPASRGRAGLYHLTAWLRGGGDVVLLVGGGRALRVALDGLVVVERRRDRSEPQVTRAALHLDEGDHRLDLWVHALGRGDGTTLALVDPQGQPALVPLEAPTSSTRGAGTHLRSESAASLRSPASGTEGSLDLEALDRWLWRHRAARARIDLTVNDERDAAATLVRRFGYAPEALVAAALSFAADDDIPRRQAWALAQPLWERALRAWPECGRARLALALAARQEQPEQGLPLFRALANDEPRLGPALRTLITDALDAGLIGEASQTAEALLSVARTVRNIDAAIPAFEAIGDAGRVAALEREREALLSSRTSDAAARRQLAQGDTDAALDLWRRAATAERFSPAFLSYVDTLSRVDAARALELVDGALRDAPDDEELLLRRCQLVLRTQGADAARGALREALLRHPHEQHLNRLGEQLGLERPWAERVALGDRIIAERRAGPEPFPGHPAVYLLDDVERSLQLDGSSWVLRHFVVELRAKEVLDRFGELDVSDERVVQLRVVKPDGRVVEPDTHAGVQDASLPELAPGDIVELLSLSHSAASPYPRSGYETRSLDLLSLPALSRAYVVDAPQALVARTGFAAVTENGAPAPERTTFVDAFGTPRVRFQTRLVDVAMARPEPFEPSRDETARTAGFAWGVDDALWARVRGRSLYLASRPSPWLVECARRIAGSGSDVEKLRRIFAFVANRVEPGEGDDATEVLATGQGRRLPLYLALLHGAGLRAEPVALHFQSQPPLSLIDNDAWNVMAVRTELQDGTSFSMVDGVVALDALPQVARGARVLDLGIAALTRDHARVSQLPESAISDDGVSVQLQLSRGVNRRELSGHVQVTVPAAFADGMRRDIRKATPDAAKAYVEQALQSSFPGLEVSTVYFPNLEVAGTPLRFGARVVIRLTPGEDGTVRFEHLFAGGAAAAFSLAPPWPAFLGVAERQRPLLVTAGSETLELELSVGDGGALLETPVSFQGSAGPFSLAQSSEVTDGTLQLRRTVRSDHARVSPEQWRALRGPLADLLAQLDAHLTFLVEPQSPGG